MPAAWAIRPQFGSRPKRAVLTSGELAIVRATRSASSAEAAPSTSTRATRAAPSPSRMISIASCSRTASSSPAGSGAPAAPVACRSTVSLVLIWPSTVIRSKEASTAARRAASGSSTTASVCTKQSIVAKPGIIIPAPFACAERVTPPARTVQLFGQRSVVRIASEKAIPPDSERPAAASPIPSSTASIGSGTPITPVSATATRSGARPRRAPASPHIAQASARPCSPVSALALPALTTAARIAARSTRSRQILTGAAAEALRVSRTEEATSSASQTRRPTSVWPPPLRPQWAAPARKPGASWAGSSCSTPAGGSTQRERKKVTAAPPSRRAPASR